MFGFYVDVKPMIFAERQPIEFAARPHAVAALRLLRLRRARAELIDEQLFGEPAWDLLLSVYVARAQHREADISMVAKWANVPMTTALRYLESLEKRDLIVRRKDPRDARRSYIAITDHAMAAVEAVFDSLQKSAGEWEDRDTFEATAERFSVF